MVEYAFEAASIVFPFFFSNSMNNCASMCKFTDFCMISKVRLGTTRNIVCLLKYVLASFGGFLTSLSLSKKSHIGGFIISASGFRR